MVDEAILWAKVSSVRHQLRRVREALPGSEQAFLADPDRRDIVVHNLWLGLQGCIDLAAHVVASEGFGQPSSLAGIFDTLAREGILEPALARRLRRAAGLRNIIVHEYVALDLSIVYRIAQTDLDDLHSFIRVLVGRYGADDETAAD